MSACIARGCEGHRTAFCAAVRLLTGNQRYQTLVPLLGRSADRVPGTVASVMGRHVGCMGWLYEEITL